MKILSLYIINLILLTTIAVTSGKPKNLQVLDFESIRDVKKYMNTVAKDLGVKCSYCHDMDDKSIDTPLKDITREMIKLTKYLNDILNVEIPDTTHHKTFVTCWTCHHGKTMPENTRTEK